MGHAPPRAITSIYTRNYTTSADANVAIDRQDLARLVDQGDGDDFPELQAAAALLSEHSALIDRLRAALVEYAAADFWDDSLPGGPLALHDAGEMARNVLSGRPHFFHRD